MPPALPVAGVAAGADAAGRRAASWSMGKPGGAEVPGAWGGKSEGSGPAGAAGSSGTATTAAATPPAANAAGATDEVACGCAVGLLRPLPLPLPLPLPPGPLALPLPPAVPPPLPERSMWGRPGTGSPVRMGIGQGGGSITAPASAAASSSGGAGAGSGSGSGASAPPALPPAAGGRRRPRAAGAANSLCGAPPPLALGAAPPSDKRVRSRSVFRFLRWSMYLITSSKNVAVLARSAWGTMRRSCSRRSLMRVRRRCSAACKQGGANEWRGGTVA
jgi:hypothetical protein